MNREKLRFRVVVKICGGSFDVEDRKEERE